MTIQTNDADGTCTIFRNPECPPVEQPGYTIRTVDALPPRPAGDLTSRLRWVDPAGLAWVAPVLTAQQVFAAAVAAGYTVPEVQPPLVLDLGSESRATFTGLMVLLNSLMSSGQLLGSSQQTITGHDGTPRSLPVSQIETILLGYGVYYANLFNALHADTVAAAAPAPAPAS